jgi:dTDP-4-amino-4,6-dideoxygalactose transaminase
MHDEKLAIDGGTPVRTGGWKARWPVIGDLERKLVMEVLESGNWGGIFEPGSMHGKLPQMEKKFAELQNAKHAIGLVNGTVAITVALQAAGVKPGDEVIVPPYTFIATASAPLAFGAIPVFVDVEEDTLLIDPEKIEQAITPRTRAIVPVHIAGGPANMTRIMEIARKHNLVVVEDAAQAVGAKWDGKSVGTIGDMGTFSLQSSKNLNSGEGGIITTNDSALWEQAWSLINVGRVPGGAWYQHERIGQNYRLTEFQAALVLAQMTRLEEQMRKREANVELLNQLLSDIDGIRLLKRDPRVTRHANHLYMFKLDSAFAERIDKEDFIRKVNAEGIFVLYGYNSLNVNKAIRERCRELTGREHHYACPISERACEKEVLWLTQVTLLEDEEAMYDIARALRKVIRSYS